MRRAIGGQRRFHRKPVGGHGPGQSLGGDLLDRATWYQEKIPLVEVRADHKVDMPASPGNDAIERTRGDDVSVDHRLPEHHAHRHLLAPGSYDPHVTR